MATKTKKTLNEKKAAKSKDASLKATRKTQVRDTRSMRRADKADAKKKKTNSRMKVKPVGRAPHSARITEVKGPIQAVASRTAFEPKDYADRKWLIVDAAGQTVGRLATEIAMLLRGKHKTNFTPNNDVGDFVIVINSEKVVFTGVKDTAKTYNWHSGYIGGLKEATPEFLRTTYPDRIIRTAVRGMVPRSPLGRDQMRKLMVYAGDKHPHAAQTPVAWKLRNGSNA